MNNIIVCKSKTADNPYTFLNTRVSVYSYEELCYYIYNNVVLIGEDDLNERLGKWISDEIEMPELGDKIDFLISKKAFAQDIMVEILTYGDYYSNEEVKSFMEECQRLRNMSIPEISKKKADGYLRYKHYIKAGAIYDDIIAYKEANGERDVFLGNIYHNKAVALAGNLQLEEAKECFIKAFSLNNNNESLIEYFCVLAVSADTSTLRKEIKKRGMPDGFFDDLMMELGDSKEDVREMSIYNKVQKAIFNRINGNLEDYDRRMDSVLDQLKDEFRSQIV
ncbi:MAG: hypothetical protein ACI4EF_01045 [Coprococcus sp.]